MVNKTREFKKGKSDVEQTLIKKLSAKKIPTKVIQYVINTVNTCEQKIIEFGK